MTNAATNAAHVAQHYIAVWNETDPNRRRALLAEHWTDDARYLDPMMQGNGHTDIDALIGAVQQRFPSFRFALHGTPDGHNDRVRFSWSLAPAGAEPVVIGSDFVQLAADGRIRSVTGFLDRVPAGA
jgi:hypothetical protein